MSKQSNKNASGQSYKQFTLVIYESGVVIRGIFKSDSRVVNYDRRGFIRLATEVYPRSKLTKCSEQEE